MRRTLVIHPGALGDVLLAIPALRGLRASTPDTALVFAAQPRLGQLLVSLGVVDEALDFEALGLAAMFAGDVAGGGPVEIREADRVVSWFGSGDETFVRNLRAVKPAAVIALPSSGHTPVWQHLRRTLDLPAAGDAESLRLAPALLDAGRAILEEAGWDGTTPLVLLHPGAGSAAKRWPVEGFASVSSGLRARRPVTLALHEGPADGEPVTALRSRLTVPALRLDRPPLLVLAGALGQAALYLGNDSGVSHLAAAVGAPSVVLFKDTFRAWQPWAPGVRVVTVSTRTVHAVDLAAVEEAVCATIA